MSQNEGTHNKIIMTPSLRTKSNQRENQHNLEEQFFVKRHFHKRKCVKLEL
jgi:hypothetical protein